MGDQLHRRLPAVDFLLSRLYAVEYTNASFDYFAPLFLLYRSGRPRSSLLHCLSLYRFPRRSALVALSHVHSHLLRSCRCCLFLGVHVGPDTCNANLVRPSLVYTRPCLSLRNLVPFEDMPVKESDTTELPEDMERFSFTSTCSTPRRDATLGS